MEGRDKRTPEGVLRIGHVDRSWFSSACAPSRAVLARSFSSVEGELRRSGFGSLARRSPRSKV